MRKLLAFSGLAAAVALIGQESGLFPVLMSSARIGLQSEGLYLLPTVQLLHPWGQLLAIKGRPVDLAFDSHKRQLAVLNSHSVLLLDGASGAQTAEVRSRATSYTGIAFRPGDRELWASETTRRGPDSLLIVQLSETGQAAKTERLSLPRHPLPAGIAFSADGKRVFVAFSRNNTLAVIDAESRHVLREVAVGMAPFGVAVSATHVFVTNRGGRRPEASDSVAPSSGSMIATDPVTGSSVSGTVSVVDTGDFSTREVPVGLAPSGISLSPDGKLAAVANGHSDSISLVDTGTLGDRRQDPHVARRNAGQPAGRHGLRAGRAHDLRGVRRQQCHRGSPPGGRRVEGGGRDAHGLVPLGAWRWIARARCASSTSRAWATPRPETAHSIRCNYEGSLERIPAPADAQVAAGTREVRAANSPRFEPAGGVANLSSLGIQHVFLIIKENRTYDQVFGDIGKGNGDPKLCVYGRDVTPNHHALAEQLRAAGQLPHRRRHQLRRPPVAHAGVRQRLRGARLRRLAARLCLEHERRPHGVADGFLLAGRAKRPLDVRIYGEFSLPARWDPVTQNVVDMNERERAELDRVLEALQGTASGKASSGSAAACPRSRNSSARAIPTTPPASPTRFAPTNICASSPSARRAARCRNLYHHHAERGSHQRHAPRLCYPARHGGG